MALKLLDAGYLYAVYNRSQEKARPFVERGIKSTRTPKELASECDVIVSCLANDSALEKTMNGNEGALAGAKAGSTSIVEMSTVSPGTSQRLNACRGGPAVSDARRGYLGQRAAS